MTYIHDTIHRTALQDVAKNKVGFYSGLSAHVAGYVWLPNGDMVDVEIGALFDAFRAQLITHKPARGGAPCQVVLSPLGEAELASWPTTSRLDGAA